MLCTLSYKSTLCASAIANSPEQTKNNFNIFTVGELKLVEVIWFIPDRYSELNSGFHLNFKFCTYRHSVSVWMHRVRISNLHRTKPETPGFVLLMILFCFYYSENLTHVKSPRRLHPAPSPLMKHHKIQFPFSSQFFPFCQTRATVSDCFLVSCVPPPPLHSCFLLRSIFSHLTNDRHWCTQGSIQSAHAQRERKEINMFF